MKIGIVIGSVREGRKGSSVAEWFASIARAHATDVDFELIDLKAFDLPLLTSATLPGMAGKKYDDERVQAWSAAIDACDGYVLVTPEYNHGVPGALKNAYDSLGPEWEHKAIAFVSYGADNGVRAVEHWRSIVSNLHMVDVRTQQGFSIFSDFGEDGELQPSERDGDKARALTDDLVSLTGKILATR